MSKDNYKRLGDYIKKVNVRNKENLDIPLMGLSIQKCFIPSIANTIGTNMTRYKVIERNQFAYGPVTSRNGEKITIALFDDYDKALISQAYVPFKIIDTEKLLPKYLMMWFSRPEFDRYARFKSHGSARETFDWDEMCDVELPIPSLEKQQEIVADYQAVEQKIKTNEAICEKLEETAQTIYRRWFEEFEFPDKNGKPYKSNGGKMVWNEDYVDDLPISWSISKLENLSQLKYGKMLSSDLFIEEGYPVFSGYGIRGYYSEYMYRKPQILVLCRGVSGTGEVRMSPPFSYITNLSIVVETDQSEIEKLYLFYFLNNSDLRSLDSGSAQSMITVKDLNRFEVLIPDNEVQRKFSRKITTLKLWETSIYNQNQKLEQFQSLLLARMTKEEELEKV